MIVRPAILCSLLCCSIATVTLADPPVAPTAPAAPARPDGKPAPAPPAAAKPAPVVRLLDAGAEPRRELRLSPKAGAKQVVEMSQRMSMEQAVGGFSMPATNMPETIITIEYEVESVADGVITYNAEVTGAEVKESQGVQPQVLQAMKRSYESAIGTKFRTTMNNRGIISSLEMQSAGRQDPLQGQQMESLREAMRNMMMPLPSEAIGVGGSWQVYTVNDLNGFTVETTTVLKVVSLDGDNVELEVAVSMDADEQNMNAPGMPAGSTVRLMSLDADGKGKSTCRFDSVAPVSSTMATQTKMNMDLDTPAMSQSMTQTTRIAVTVKAGESKKKAAPAAAE
ncbi:MAG TPA: DUF6263 family protein [Phycisphaerales bacterium]|nr:DUF6263 family protein [Phycisphaerales bacterium]HRQ76394.1 DUF6263 family protein [Phycisphaerales bacterium]